MDDAQYELQIENSDEQRWKTLLLSFRKFMWNMFVEMFQKETKALSTLIKQIEK